MSDNKLKKSVSESEFTIEYNWGAWWFWAVDIKEWQGPYYTKSAVNEAKKAYEFIHSREPKDVKKQKV